MIALPGHDPEAVWLVACGFGLAAVVALVALYRRAAARRELEIADQLIDEAYREDPG